MKTTSKKPRRDKNESVLRKLPAEQRAKVDEWLFEDQATYKEVIEACQKEFGVAVSRSSLARYWKSRGRERELGELALPAEPKTPRERYEAVLDGVERRALVMSRARPQDVKSRDLADLVHLIIAARRESNEACRVALARDKLEYDVATACLVHKIGMDRICEDRTLNEGERIRAIREELFGENLPE